MSDPNLPEGVTQRDIDSQWEPNSLTTEEPMRKEYEMTDEQFNKIMEASRPVPLLYISGGIPIGRSPRENANDAWKELGDELGFDFMSVEPGKSKKHFTAEPKL